MDLISRQQAVDAILNDKVELTEEIKAIGSTELFKTLNMTCDRHAKILRELPSAEPQTGKWIHDGSHWANRWICDRCKYKLFGVKTKFCPDCGQRMEADNE